MKRATCTGPPSGEPVQVVFISRRRPAGAGLVGGVGNWPAKNWPARTWCTKPRKTLFLRFLCTKSQVIFGAGPAKTWCTNSRKPLFLRFLCTKSQAIFGAGPAKTWCTNSRKPLFLRFLCTKSQAIFGTGPAGTWCTNSRKPLFLRLLCTKSQIRFASQPAKLAPGSSQSHIPPSGHANTGAVFPARGRPCWRLAPRKAFVFRQATPTPAPSSRRVAD